MKRLVTVLVLVVLLAACAGVGVSQAPRPTPKALGTPRAASSGTPAPLRRVDTTAVANTSAAAGAALVEQAISYLLDRYVEPLRADDVYRIAFDGAAQALRAAGRSPAVSTLTFTADRKSDAATFKSAYLALAEQADSGVNQSALAYAAISALTAAVDECHTYFLDPEQAKRAKEQSAGQESFTGIGVVINSSRRPATIVKVYRGSPAEVAGLREGDAFLRVDGIDVTDLPADQIGPLVRGPEGSTVRITVRRPDTAAPLEVTITRAKISVPVFEKEIKTLPDGKKVGYMALYSFSAQLTRTGVGDGVEKDLQAALEEFEGAGVTGWVLDLRNNPGGYIATLSRVASRFIKGNAPVVYYVREGGTKIEAVKTDQRGYFTPQHPFAVLINGGSGSSSEAFAAAAQDYGFARVFGQQSAGCLAAGLLLDLADGSALNVTVEKVISPQKREINRVGVTPDVVVGTTPGEQGDRVLDAALAWIAGQP